MSHLEQQSNTPEIRTFQMDAGGIGDAQKSVNLFRGDVNLPIKVLSLPGANGLNVDVTAFYQSNVRQQAETWNLEAPTSVLGLGWSLPYDRIVLANPDNGTIHGNQYFISSGGTTQRLLYYKKHGNQQRYKTETYQPWRIDYDSTEEQWQITRENGVTYIYGGKSQSGNTVQWGVKWGNWYGSSKQKSGQKRFALAWNLHQIKDLWGNTITYIYDEDELPVCTSGKNYTRASYLKQITDIHGRTVVFDYKDKVFSTALQEYQDPHKFLRASATAGAPPINLNSPSGHQSHYETKYLHRMTVNNGGMGISDEHLLFAIQFNYALDNATNDSKPESFKRYLTSIVQQNRYGEPLPGMKFAYYTASTDVQPGALKTVTYPTGSSTDYTYEKVELSHAHRKNSIYLSGSTPRVWFGPDYAVIVLHKGNNVKLSVYSWAGRWREKKYTLAGSCNAEAFKTLRVTAQQDFFAIYWRGARKIQVYRRRRNAFDGWTYCKPIRCAAAGTSETPVSLVSGKNFFILYDAGQHSSKVRGYYRRSADDEWRSFTGHLPGSGGAQHVALAARGNKFIVYTDAKRETNNIHFGYFDDKGMPTRNKIKISLTKNQPLWWSLSETFAVATYLTATPGANINYAIKVLKWSGDGEKLRDLTPKSHTFQVPHNAHAIPFVAQIHNNSLITTGKDAFRYVGKNATDDRAWNHKTLSISLNASDAFDFASGDDTLVVTHREHANKIQSAIFSLSGSRGGWRTSRIDSSVETATLGGRYLTLDSSAYFQTPTSKRPNDWKRAGTLRKSPKDGTVRNAAPAYVLYTGSDHGVYAAFPKNGEISGTLEALGKTKHYLADHAVGTQLQAASMFATWEGASFDSARKLSLYWVVGQSAQRPLTDYRVSQIAINDAYPSKGLSPQQHVTAFRYVNATASISPAGNVTQYSKVTTIPGGTTKPYGYTEHYFHNGLPLSDSSLHMQASSYDAFDKLVNGFPAFTISYDASGRVVAASTSRWRKWTAKLEGTSYLRTAYQKNLSTLTELSSGSLKLGPSNQDVVSFVKKSQPQLSGNAFVYAWDSDDNDARGSHDWWMVVDGASNTYIVERTTGTQATVYTGLTQTVAMEYNGHGLPKKTASFYADHAGQRIKKEQIVTYGSDLDSPYRLSSSTGDGMKDIHLLNAVIHQKQQTFQVDSDGTLSAPITTAAQATTWKRDWGGQNQWAPEATYVAQEPAAANASFNFVSPQAGWLKTSHIRWRSFPGLQGAVQGAVRDVEDVYGRNNVTVFDNTGIPVAQFYGDPNSIFASFETLDTPGWHFSNAHTTPDPGGPFGKASLQINRGNGLLKASLDFEYDPHTPEYVVSFWVKIPREYNTAFGSFNLTISADEGTLGKTFALTSGTGGTWRYFYYPFSVKDIMGDQTPIPGNGGNWDIALENKNTRCDILMTDFRYGRAEGSFTAFPHDPYEGYVTAQYSNNAEVVRLLYDDFRRPLAAIDPHGNLQSISVAYNSVRGNHGAYKASDPSSALTVTAGGGTYFGKGFDTWQSQWTPQANAQNWKVKEGALWHTVGTSNDTLNLIGSGQQKNFGLYFKLGEASSEQGSPESPRTFNLTHPLRISFGSDTYFQWNASNPSWELYVGGTRQASHAESNANAIARSWLLLVIEDTLFFYGDGRQLIAHAAGAANAFSHQVSMTTGDAIALCDVTFFADPMISLAYMDSLGRTRQTQAMELAVVSPAVTPTLNILAAETLFDDMGRSVVATQGVRYKKTLPGYKPTLVTTYDPATGKITAGDVLTSHPDDEGYPFSRTRYEASPLSRVLEQGQPGAELAITTGTRHTVRKSYAVNKAGDWTNLPAGQYVITTAINADGVVAQTVTNAAGQLIIVRKDSTGANQVTKYTYDRAGRPLSTQLPNGAKNTSTYDFLSRETRVTTVDSGTTQYRYDKAGRLRFVQDAEGAAHGYIQYTTYDSLGRRLENGTVASSLSALTAAQIDDARYIPSATSRTVCHSYVYDLPPGSEHWKPNEQAFGAAPYLLGRLYRVTTHGSTDKTTETYQYDLLGNVLDKALQVNSETPHHTAYAYDNLGNVTRITHQTSPPLEVYYSYDLLGRMAGVGTRAGGTDLAAYTYTPQGGLATEALASKAIQRSYQYNSAGWISKIDDNFLTARFSYFTGRYDDTTQGYYGGDIAKLAYTDKLHSAKSFNYAYLYDSLGRLLVANNSQDSKWDVGVGAATSFDGNGNIKALKRGSTSAAYTYDDNTNRVKNTDGSDTQAYGYDHNGNIITTPSRTVDNQHYDALTLAYDRFTNMTRSVRVGSANTVTFLYDSHNRRVQKKSTTPAATTRYLHGLGSQPLVEERGSETTHYVYGLRGLLAVQKAGNWYGVLNDHEGSVQRVVDARKTVHAAYDYLPFGDPMRSTEPSFLNYRYTGQEFDAETGLYNLQARLYDSDLGRFYAIDPAGQFASPYLYAGDDPVRFTDPSGLFSWEALGAAAASLGMIAGGVAFFYIPGATGTLMGAGVSGLIYGARHIGDDSGTDFRWDRWGRALGAGAIGGLEVQAGVGLSLATEGAGYKIGGGALIGAGVNGITYAGFHGDEDAGDFWKGYAFEQGKGAVAGAITGAAGAGSVALAAKTTSTVGKFATLAGGGALGGAGADAADQSIGLAAHYGLGYGDKKSYDWKETAFQGGVGLVAGGLAGGASARSRALANKEKEIYERCGFTAKSNSGSEVSMTKTNTIQSEGLREKYYQEDLPTGTPTQIVHEVSIFTGNRFPLVAVTVFNTRKLFPWHF